ncbi:MAG TPA: efflux transporter outer membrane subunit [Bryobacteraceae bacterium]|jgi:NodT family efflux transporter outer membrane factor (OMF) lipoprotein|nr:efflux transporter outer membrane subunit [Bryobacteraceae bacterium]
MRQWALFTGMAAVLLFSSCNPAPKYVKPVAPTPVSYKEAAPEQFKEGAGWKVAQPSDDKIRAKWWEMYNDPQLNALEERASTANQTLAAAEANYRAARALVVSARAALYPTISTAPAYSNSRISGTRGAQVINPGNPGSSGFSKAYNDFSLPIDVSYTVDFWHRIRNTIAANAYSAQASAADVATSLLSIQSTLAQDYFQVRALDMQRSVLEDTLRNYRDTLNLTQTLYRAGIDSEEDVTLAQTQLDTATAQATDLGVARAQYEHAIATLIGEPAADFSLAVAPFVPKPPTVPVALPSVLLERRPDIAAAERQIAALNAEIGVARAAYYPNLTLSASGGLESSSFTQWFTWPSRFWALGPTLSQTIWEGGARRGQNEQAQANYDAGVANYRQTVLSAFQAVEDNLSSLRILAQEIEQDQTAIESSAHYLQLALVRYKSGVDSYLNVITAQNAVLSNRETQVQAQLREMVASVSLVLALGGGWDRSQLPSIEHLTDKQRGWEPGGPKMPPATNEVSAPNPPQVPPAPLQPPAANHTGANR